MPSDRPHPPPVFGLVGWHNAGKTTLMVALVAELTSRGLIVSTIKRAHHGFDVDQPGKDSYRHRAAGAQEVLVASPTRWALMHELRNAPEPALNDLLARFSPADLVLVEGFKGDPIPKIEIHRFETGAPQLLAPRDPNIVALATDATARAAAALAGVDIPVFDLADIRAIADLTIAHCGAKTPQHDPAF